MAAQDQIPLSVQAALSRTASASADFTPGGAYAAGATIGGLISVDIGKPSTLVRMIGAGFVVPMSSNTTPGGNAGLVIFGEEPTGTYEDGTAPTWAATDTNRIKRVGTFTFVYGPSSASLAAYATQSFPQPIDLTSDADGMVYFIVLLSGTVAWDTPGSARFTVDYLY